jgi:hypothetical protein
MKRWLVVTCGMAFGLTLAVATAAQETAPAGESAQAPEAAAAEAPSAQGNAESRRPPRLVRVQIVLLRYRGERKLSSLPYTVLASTDNRNVRVRMGVEVPVSVPPGYQYKNVGTNIDCRVEERAQDLYQVRLDAENSSVYRRTEDASSGVSSEASIAEDRPMFRTFKVSISPVLHDGQSVQGVASTDPVTGEVVKIDLTLNVVR